MIEDKIIEIFEFRSISLFYGGLPGELLAPTTLKSDPMPSLTGTNQLPITPLAILPMRCNLLPFSQHYRFYHFLKIFKNMR